jgi:hypothetical protein
MSYKVGIWGPIATDQFRVSNIPYIEEPVYLLPKWGGCGLNQAIIFDRLNRAYGTKFEALLFSSVGTDFNEVNAEFRGYTRTDILESLKTVKPVLHQSERRTTAFDVSLKNEKENSSTFEIPEIIEKGIKEMKNDPYYKKDKEGLRQIESRIRAHHQTYRLMKDEGRDSILDFKDPQVVIRLLDSLEEEYPQIMSISGGTFEVQKSIIEGIRSYETTRRKIPSKIVYDPGSAILGLGRSTLPARRLLSDVDILRSNKEEHHELKGGRSFREKHSKGIDPLLEHTDIVIATSAKSVSLFTRQEPNSLTKYVIDSIPFCIACAQNFLKIKSEKKAVGVQPYEFEAHIIESTSKPPHVTKHARKYDLVCGIHVERLDFSNSNVVKTETSGAGDTFTTALLYSLVKMGE